MSEETDKVISDASGCDEDEEWLYGDDNEEKPELSADEETVDNTITEPTAKEVSPSGGETEENGKVKADSESDSDDDDDDDDVCVTIGDIRTGGLSQYTNFGSAPVNLNIKSDGRTHAIVGTKTKGVDLDAPGSVNGMPVLEADIEAFEEKPWRKPGADISDYFNYGFNEDSWKSYCEKQRRVRGSYEGMNLSSTQIMVQQGRSGHGDKDSHCDYASLGSQYKSAQRKSSSSIDVIGGQTGSISRVEGRRRHNNEGENIQVLSEASPDADSSANKISPFFPPNIPPPPFLPPPHGSAPPLIPPPHIPISVPPPGYPPGAPPPSLMQSLNSGHSGGYEGPPMPPFPLPPGVFPHLASWPGVMESAKAWEYYARQGQGRERDKGRERSRERGHDKERERGRDRDREHSPSSQPNSEEERQRHRDHGERGYRSNREAEERHREKRHRDKDEGRHKPARSSSSKRKHESEEGDSGRRHRHKKTKRSKEDKEDRHKPSTDQENHSEPTE
ncbi:pre-mRNA 3'-end-processing factor FIP1 [Aplochiton taeniatus]